MYGISDGVDIVIIHLFYVDISLMEVVLCLFWITVRQAGQCFTYLRPVRSAENLQLIW